MLNRCPHSGRRDPAYLLPSFLSAFLAADACLNAFSQPSPVDRLAVVEDVLAAIVRAEDGPRCAVRELAFAELHGLIHVNDALP